MRVLLWHVHGSYTTALVRGDHTWLLPVDTDRGPDGRGRAQTWDWPPNAVEITRDTCADTDVDVVVQNASTLGPVPLRLLVDTDCEALERVFDVKIQGKTVLRNVDPVKLAGAANRGIERAVEGVAVKDRLTKEITYWDHRAGQLKQQEQAGKAGARLNSQEARRRAEAQAQRATE